jgi:hypothetical protein
MGPDSCLQVRPTSLAFELRECQFSACSDFIVHRAPDVRASRLALFFPTNTYVPILHSTLLLSSGSVCWHSSQLETIAAD